MTGPNAADLVRRWPLTTAPSHTRLLDLLEALDGPDARRRPLGAHHQRLLGLHRDCVGTVLDAVVSCGQCGEDSEFVVPLAPVLDLPTPSFDATVTIDVGDVATSFRLPTVADLDGTVGQAYADAVRILAARTCCSDPVPEVDDAELGALATAWEEADPAATLVVELVCASCTASLSAAVDPAEFVARELDRYVDRLLGQVHALATAYGWDEDTVLALPDGRRHRYLALVGARPDTRQLSLATS